MPWQPRVPHHTIAPACRAWLIRGGSLTAHLRAVFPNLSVRVLRQTRARPHADEARLLGLRADEWAWVREVLLCDGATPLVCAHSVLPLSARRGPWRLFAGLGTRPLGEVLFSTPAITRGALSFRSLDARHPLYRLARPWAGQTAPSALWARRSRFVCRARPLLVTEIFLPALLRFPA